MEKLIITVAPTGAWPTKKNNPNVPLQPEEIAEEVYRSWQAGASIAHIHVREDDGTPGMNFEKFKETVELIREKCDIVLNLTTSGGLDLKEEDRMRPFRFCRNNNNHWSWIGYYWRFLGFNGFYTGILWWRIGFVWKNFCSICKKMRSPYPAGMA